MNRDTGGGTPPPLERSVKVIAAIVVLGAIMTVLDATIVSVAIDTLSKDFGSALATIQWVMTGYVLALSAVIPITGWAADRFGAAEAYAQEGRTLALETGRRNSAAPHRAFLANLAGLRAGRPPP